MIDYRNIKVYEVALELFTSKHNFDRVRDKPR